MQNYLYNPCTAYLSYQTAYNNILNHPKKSIHIMTKNKIDEVIGMYDFNVDDAAVAKEVKELLDAHLEENMNKEVYRTILSGIELTTLKNTDCERSVIAMTEKVNRLEDEHPELPPFATICVYPCFAEAVKNTLTVEGTGLTCVSGSFPSSQARLEVKVAETSLAVADGATDIDIVLSVGRFLDGDYESVVEEISELKEACRDRILKVILETGCLRNGSDIKLAAMLAMYSGADFIKTSTGKEKVSATPEAAYIMCRAIKEYFEKTGIRIGLKPAGGINTVRDAVAYYTIVKEVLGEEWLNSDYLRYGTSRLTNLIMSELLGEEVKYF